MKKLKSFTRDRDMLASVLNENTTCYITSKDKLFFWDDSDFEKLRVLGDLDENEEVIHEFTLPRLTQYPDTDYERLAFYVVYSDKNFDTEFKAEEVGVLERIKDSEYKDVLDIANTLKISALERIVNEWGYTLDIEIKQD